MSIYDEVTEQTTVCSKGQVEPTDMKDNSAAWILVVTNLDSDTEYLVYDSNSGEIHNIEKGSFILHNQLRGGGGGGGRGVSK